MGEKEGLEGFDEKSEEKEPQEKSAAAEPEEVEEEAEEEAIARGDFILVEMTGRAEETGEVFDATDEGWDSWYRYDDSIKHTSPCSGISSTAWCGWIVPAGLAGALQRRARSR